MKRVDFIFVVRMDYDKFDCLNKVLFDHFNKSIINILEIGCTYIVSVHFIDFIGLHKPNPLIDFSYIIKSNKIINITFNNIEYHNKDKKSIEDLYQCLSFNIYNIICDKKNITSFTSGRAKLDLIGVLENSKFVNKGFDFEGLNISYFQCKSEYTLIQRILSLFFLI